MQPKTWHLCCVNIEQNTQKNVLPLPTRKTQDQMHNRRPAVFNLLSSLFTLKIKLQKHSPKGDTTDRKLEQHLKQEEWKSLTLAAEHGPSLRRILPPSWTGLATSLQELKITLQNEVLHPLQHAKHDKSNACDQEASGEASLHAKMVQKRRCQNTSREMLHPGSSISQNTSIFHHKQLLGSPVKFENNLVYS